MVSLNVNQISGLQPFYLIATHFPENNMLDLSSSGPVGRPAVSSAIFCAKEGVYIL